MTASPVAPPLQPVQVWHCGRADHRHVAKADAVRCLERREDAPDAAHAIGRLHHSLALAEGALAKSDTPPGPAGSKPYGDVLYADPGYRADGRKRYPIDTEMHIRAAWAYINKPKNARKYTPDQVASITSRIIAAWKEVIDPAGPVSARGDADGEGAKAAHAMSLRKGLCEVGEIAHLIVALHRLDERLAVEATVEADSSPLPARLQAIIGELCDFLTALVAEETQELIAGDGMREPPPPALAAEIVVMAAGISGSDVADILRKSGNADLDALASALAKLGALHTADDQRLLDHVHSCLETLTNGACCTAEKAVRHTKKTGRHLQRAHDHVCAAGARCVGTVGAGDDEGAAGKVSRPSALAKMRGDNVALIKTLDDIVPRLDRLARRVEDIAQTPLPPLTHARGPVALSKRDDGGAAQASEEIVAALSRMTQEERTMALIKAAYANPIRPGSVKNPA